MRYGITEGSWKLILPSRKKPAELYELSTDRAESNNLAASHPEKVASLTAKMNALIVNGRSTPGAPQANDTGYWKDLSWMRPEDFQSVSQQ
ncbi:hypothetical protein [Thalassobacterium maritimum]|nr:hypothetical protein [Coraliomargarita sp. SDUM461003]